MYHSERMKKIALFGMLPSFALMGIAALLPHGPVAEVVGIIGGLSGVVVGALFGYHAMMKTMSCP